MSKSFHLAAALALGTVLTFSPAAFAHGRRNRANREARSATSDKTFITRTAEDGMAEVELGNLAKDRASNNDVKQFADRMVTDHTKANDELSQIAGKQNVSLPTEVNAKDKALKDRLSKLSGAEFDKAYMDAMVRDHRKAVAEFRRESERASNADVKSFASKTLPTLEEHLRMAENTASKLSGTSAGTTTATGSQGTAAREKPTKNKKY